MSAQTSTVTTGERGEIRHVLASKADALRLVRGMPSGSVFYVHVHLDAPLLAEPDMTYRDMMSGTVKLTRVAAINLVKSLLSDRVTKRGAGLAMTRDEWPQYNGKPQKQVLWIG